MGQEGCDECKAVVRAFFFFFITDNDEFAQLCGYSDRLMSSRVVRMNQEGAIVVKHRCERELGIDEGNSNNHNNNEHEHNDEM
jgi:hypothetical protein